MSGKAVIVIDTNGLLLQAVYMDSELKGIAFNEANGKVRNRSSLLGGELKPGSLQYSQKTR